MLDGFLDLVADYYHDHLTVDDDSTLATNAASALRAVVAQPWMNVTKLISLLDELASSVPVSGWIGDNDTHDSWLDFLRSVFNCVDDDSPIVALVIERIERKYDIDYAEHQAERCRFVHARDVAASA